MVLRDGLDAAVAGEVSAGEGLAVRGEVPPGSIDVRGLGTEVFPGHAD